MKKLLLTLLMLPCLAQATELRNTDWFLEVTRGKIPGWGYISKFGANSDVNDGVEELVSVTSSNSYPWSLDPSTAPITHIKQITDTAADRGAGVEIQGLDVGRTQCLQTVALDASNTTNPVALTTPLSRAFRIKVVTNVVLGADIALYDSSISTNYLLVQAGKNQTLFAGYTIPAGKKGYLLGYYCDYVRTAAKDPNGIEFFVWAADRKNNYEFQIKHEKGIPKQAAGFQHDFPVAPTFSEQTDIYISAQPEGANANVHAGFDLLIEDVD